MSFNRIFRVYHTYKAPSLKSLQQKKVSFGAVQNTLAPAFIDESLKDLPW